MKWTFCFLLLIAATLFSCEEIASQNKLKNQVFGKKYSNFYIGPQGYYFRDNIQSIASPFHGSLWGAKAGYFYRKPNHLYASVSGNWAIGKISNKPGPSRSIHDELLESQFGYVFSFYKMQWVPFGGLGFHYLVQHRQSIPTLTSLKFKYRNYYFPLGFQWNYFFIDQAMIGCHFQWNRDLDPMVQISGLFGSYWKLKHRNGYRISIPFEYFLQCNYRLSISIEPFWMWYELGATYAQSSNNISLEITKQIIQNIGALSTFHVYF